ncbi:uncharacterized protein L201_002812 [Kwoniella dendrophila CBS 6074]|uniref:Uncharacterized protein n=1 Tax=Kwoniella dendrophila CBS 6074 TaxID=1295534 RepID=A0AAX4JTH8_9TREE
MDIIHKLNPFHRPSSSLRHNNTPTPTPTFNPHTFSGRDRPSSSLESGSGEGSTNNYSIDSTLPPHSIYYNSENDRYVTSPLPPPSPLKPSNGHHRTPSILRSLAHHPSLSALKSKSKKKRKNKEIAPPLPDFTISNNNHDSISSPVPWETESQSKRNTLKFSRSLPRDMRLSDDQQEQVPPIPSHPLLSNSISNQMTYPRGAKDTKSMNRKVSIRRKPAPSPAAEDILSDQSIDYDHFSTPESMRIKMKFELDLPARSTSLEQTQSHLATTSINGRDGLGLGSPRRRYLSFDERLSPHQSRIHRLSSPAGSPSRPLKTTQHPHPIPQSHLYAQSLYADSTTFFSTDFGAPSGPPLEWHDEEVDDGLDLSVENHILPPGTPGSKKAKLKQVISNENVRQEEDVRFFSRDTYPPVSATPSPQTTPSKTGPASSSPIRSITHKSPLKSPVKHRRAESSPACSPMRKSNKTKSDEFAKAAKRSSSPFEVKLSANVTKRMSLDAFGASTLSKPEYVEEKSQEILETPYSDEVGKEESLEGSFEDKHDPDEYQLRDDGLEGYEAHELSKITESPWSKDHSTNHEYFLDQTPDHQHTTIDTTTKFFTPISPILNAQGSRLMTTPERSPLIRRKYMSAPPTTKTTSLSEAQADHSEALQDQLRAEEFMMDILKSEIDDLREALRTETREKEEHLIELQKSMMQLDEWKGRSENQDIALSQLRQAIHENEEFFEKIQEAYDVLAERYTYLEEENSNLIMDKVMDGENIQRLKKEIESLKSENRDEKENAQLTKDKKDLENVVLELRRELKWAEDQIEEKSSLVQEKERMVEEKDNVIESIQDQNKTLQDSIAQLQQEVNTVQIAMVEKDEKIKQLESSIKDHSTSQEAFSVISFELASAKASSFEKEKVIEELRGQILYTQEELEKQQSLTKEAEMSLHEQEFVIGSLREQLDSTQHSLESLNLFLNENDEKIGSLVTELSQIREDITSVKGESVQKDAVIADLQQKIEVSRFEKNENRFQAEVEITQLREKLEELSRNSAEREWADRQSTEMLARLMEEKRVWEEEKGELMELIEQNSIDEQSASNLCDQINDLNNQLISLNHHIKSIQGELEDEKSAVIHKNTLIHAQEAESSALRSTVNQFEETTLASKESFNKKVRDTERVSERLRERIEELEIQLDSRENALKESIIRNESNKASSDDVNSRLLSYLNEIDQLKLSEIKLKNELTGFQKQSSNDALKSLELEKRLKNLEEDKELLNIALESRTLELTLLQRTNTNNSSRRHIPSTPSTSIPTSSIRSNSTLSTSTRSTRNSLSYSTSKIPNTPTPSTGFDNTPLPKRLTTSTSATSFASKRRDTISTPAAAASLSTRIPLGLSTKHNKPSEAPNSRPATSIGAVKSSTRPSLGRSTSSSNTNTPSTTTSTSVTGEIKRIERRTSLPVLIRRPSSVMSSQNGRRESLSRVDEV